MPAQGWQNPGARWLLLAPAGAVAVDTRDRQASIAGMRTLAPGTSVGLSGRRGLRSIARHAGVDLERTYVVLPDSGWPVAMAAYGAPLRWVAGSVLTVPSGRWRGHFWATLAVRLCRVAPWLLGMVGHRVAIGRRR